MITASVVNVLARIAARKKRKDDPKDGIDREVSELLSMSNKSAEEVAGNPTASTSAGDAILAGIANDFDLVYQCGEDIPEQLASLVDKLLQTKMNEEKLKEKQNRYLIRKVANAIQVSQKTCTSFSTVKTSDACCDIAGRVAKYVDSWRHITNDIWLLPTIQGVNIEFDQIPVQNVVPKQFGMSDIERGAVAFEIKRLLSKGVIIPSRHESGEFISTIFVRPKKDGSYRLILNLKQQNNFVTYHHFKMESVQTALHLMKKNCFMGSIDLCDAYYSIPISQQHQKYLKFCWQGQLYQFTCLPNGLACVPRTLKNTQACLCQFEATRPYHLWIH